MHEPVGTALRHPQNAVIGPNGHLRHSPATATMLPWTRRSSTAMSRLSWPCSATSRATYAESGSYSRTRMAKKKPGNLTPEDHARHERIMEMVRKRIAYHE